VIEVPLGGIAVALTAAVFDGDALADDARR